MIGGAMTEKGAAAFDAARKEGDTKKMQKLAEQAQKARDKGTAPTAKAEPKKEPPKAVAKPAAGTDDWRKESKARIKEYAEKVRAGEIDPRMPIKDLPGNLKERYNVLGISRVADALNRKYSDIQVAKERKADPPKVIIKGKPIKDYATFEKEAMKAIKQVQKTYKTGNTIPIFRVKEALESRFDRGRLATADKPGQFHKWLNEMQARDKFNFLSGDMPTLTPRKADGSIKTSLGYARYYIELPE